MRRDQVFKVCANQYLTPDIKMKPNTTSDRSLVWTAIDFADEQPKQEMFAIKFKTPEMAVAFKNKFEECQELLKNAPTTTEITATKKQIEGKVEKQSLSDIFKPKVGSWECSQCLISNPADKNKCMACSYQRPGGDASGKDVKMTASASPGFSFGKPSTTNEKSSGLTIGSGTSVPQTGTGFTFGASPQ
ncbi:E3 SUMO-protein ligase RanBP2-like, partial [Saccoglossus kowalevskii]